MLELWVRPDRYEGGDMPSGPTPAQAGLEKDCSYLVIDMVHDNDEDSETLLMVVNHEGEIWSISNRHMRVVRAFDTSGKERSLINQLMEGVSYEY